MACGGGQIIRFMCGFPLFSLHVARQSAIFISPLGGDFTQWYIYMTLISETTFQGGLGRQGGLIGGFF